MTAPQQRPSSRWRTAIPAGSNRCSGAARDLAWHQKVGDPEGEAFEEAGVKGRPKKEKAEVALAGRGGCCRSDRRAPFEPFQSPAPLASFGCPGPLRKRRSASRASRRAAFASAE